MDAEQRLFGGLVDRVVRVGDTVRRPYGPWTRTVQALLAHLESKDVPAPRPLGCDAQGREVVSYLNGEAGLWPWPEGLRALDGIRQLGVILRRYHRAVADFDPPGPCIWQAGPRELREGEVVCHGDLHPSNLIWEGSELVGLIDWEQAYPAPALFDLADAAWKTVPLCPDDVTPNLGFAKPPNRRLRLAALADGYGLSDLEALIDSVRRLQEREYRRIVDLGQAGRQPWQTYLEKGLAERTSRDQRWLQSNAGVLGLG